MIITRGREHTVNMGNYESLKISASVTVDTAELVIPIDQDNHVRDFLEAKLSELLANDLAEAGALTNVKDSYILSWEK